MKQKNKLKGALKFYLQWPIYLTVLLLFIDIYIIVRDKRFDPIINLFVLLYFFVVIAMYFFKKPTISEALVKYAVDYVQIQRKLLKELTLPYAILDMEGHLLWSNDEFSDIIGFEKKAKRSISNVFPDITKNVLPSNEQDVELHVKIEESNYKVVLRQMIIPSLSEEKYLSGAKSISTNNDDSLVAMYLYDETEIISLKQDNIDQKLIIGLLYIDNYEEALESIDEVRRSLLTALVDRKINKYMLNIDAVIKKMEKDKYFFVFQNKYLSQLQTTKFPLLDEVRTVNIGNEMSVTISMGLGINAENFARGYEFARAAIDLALGRGGDQVVIKGGDNVQYYGGKSASVEKNTRVKARVKAHALREFVEAKDRVVVMGHSIADVDSFGAAIGVYRIAKTLNKKAHVVLNEITSAIRPIVNRFINSPDYDEDLIINGTDAMNIVDDNTLLVLVDVNRPSYTECPQLIELTKTVVILDHHRQTGEEISNAVLSYVEPYASSACEMVAEILQYIGDGLKLRQVEADALYSGIMIDTNNFLTKTGVRTFEAAAFLRRNGADVTRIRKAFRTEIVEYITKAEAVASMEIFQNCYAIAECGTDGIESPTVLGAKVANELLNIINIKASFVFTMFNNKVYVSARSIDELNVQVVMEKLGGGGHMSVAGAQFKEETVEEAINKVKEVLKTMTVEGEI